jgi:tRNA threonylcarbamoyladenosine biosynthesis protein TsaB
MNAPPAGPVLAFDTSTPVASVAVGEGGRVLAERAFEAAARASAELLPAVDAAVREAGLAPRGLGAVVVGAGPGSFTGVRIAAATAKGLVRALRAPLFAYSSLLAAAAVHRDVARAVCALFDARNRDVYAGCWRFGPDGVDEVLSPAAGRVDAVLERLGGGPPPLFTGRGAALHRDLVEAAFGPGTVVAGGEGSLAAALLWLAHAAPGAGRVADAAAWEPDYLRAAGAERIAAAGGRR